MEVIAIALVIGGLLIAAAVLTIAWATWWAIRHRPPGPLPPTRVNPDHPGTLQVLGADGTWRDVGEPP